MREDNGNTDTCTGAQPPARLHTQAYDIAHVCTTSFGQRLARNGDCETVAMGKCSMFKVANFVCVCICAHVYVSVSENVSVCLCACMCVHVRAKSNVYKPFLQL